MERDLIFVGSAKEDLTAFDVELRQAFGYGLWLIQCGDTPDNAKPGEVPGTMKLVEDQDGNTYRVVYVVRLRTAVFVLDALKKKSKRGIATPKHDLDRIRARLVRAGEIDREREKGARR